MRTALLIAALTVFCSLNGHSIRVVLDSTTTPAPQDVDFVGKFTARLDYQPSNAANQPEQLKKRNESANVIDGPETQTFHSYDMIGGSSPLFLGLIAFGVLFVPGIVGFLLFRAVLIAWKTWKPFYVARFGSQHDIEQYWRYSYFIDRESDQNLLFEAIQEVNYDRVKALVMGGAYVNAYNPLGNTPLHLAVMNGHVALARLLIQNGADREARNGQHRTPEELVIDFANNRMNAGRSASTTSPGPMRTASPATPTDRNFQAALENMRKAKQAAHVSYSDCYAKYTNATKQVRKALNEAVAVQILYDEKTEQLNEANETLRTMEAAAGPDPSTITAAIIHDQREKVVKYEKKVAKEETEVTRSADKLDKKFRDVQKLVPNLARLETHKKKTNKELEEAEAAVATTTRRPAGLDTSANLFDNSCEMKQLFDGERGKTYHQRLPSLLSTRSYRVRIDERVTDHAADDFTSKFKSIVTDEKPDATHYIVHTGHDGVFESDNFKYIMCVFLPTILMKSQWIGAKKNLLN